MADFTLQEQANRYLSGELTLEQLERYVSDSVIRDFRYSERNSDESRFADFMVGIFAEYALDCNLLGQSYAKDELRESLAEYLFNRQIWLNSFPKSNFIGFRNLVADKEWFRISSPGRILEVSKKPLSCPTSNINMEEYLYSTKSFSSKRRNSMGMSFTKARTVKTM